MTQNIAKAGSSNTGEGRGGAIFARHTTLVVKQATVVDNKASNSNSNKALVGPHLPTATPSASQTSEKAQALAALQAQVRILRI